MRTAAAALSQQTRSRAPAAVQCALSHAALASRTSSSHHMTMTTPPTSTRCFTTSTKPLFAAAGEQFTIGVPPLGDSITEGTIAELTKSAGDAVNVDDIIAMIETDKVTVDIRSPHSGVIEAYAVEEGSNVEVGDDLVTVTLGEGVKAPAAKPVVAAAPAAEVAAPVAVAVAAMDARAQHGSTRTTAPAIQFRHGANKGAARHTTTSSSSSSDNMFDSAAFHVGVAAVPAQYTDPAWTDAYIAAVDSGGADYGTWN
jgi:biotin carboxyl carrier protein